MDYASELEQPLHAILEAAADGITAQDPTGKLIYANSAAARLIGYASVEALLAAPLAEIMQQFEVRDAEGQPFPLGQLPGRRALEGEASPEVMLRFRVKATGEERWSLVRANPVFNARGEVAFAVNTFHDITALKQAEERVARLHEQAEAARQQYEVTLASIGDGVIATDATGAVTFMNAVASTLTGWQIHEALGRNISEVFAIVNEYTQEPVKNPVREVFERGAIVGLANHTVLIARDGTEYLIDDSGAPIRDAQGTITGAVLVFHDVTEQRRAEQLLRRQEQELRDFVENAAISLHWVDAEGRILWANQAELDLLGFTREEYFGHHIAEFHVDQDVIDDILNCLTNNETLHNREARMRCKDGSIRYVLIDSNVMWEEGKFLHTRCFTRDVTVQQHAAREFDANRLRLQAIFDNVQNAILIADDAGHYVDANPAACLLTGYSREELLRLSIGDVSSEDRKAVLGETWETFTKSKQQQGEYVIRQKDGTTVETEFRAVANFLPGLHLSVLQDVSQRKHAERQLGQRLAQMEAIYDLSSAVNRAEKLEQIYTIALEGLVDHLGADRGSILLFDADEVMHFKAWRGLSETYRQQTDGHSPWSRDTQNAEPILVADVEQEPSLDALRDIIKQEGIQALAFIPLLSDRKLLGKFMIYYNDAHHFSEAEVQFVQTLASHVAFAIERQSIEQSRLDLLQREHLARLQAEKADALKLQFLAMISHELRTPLTSIKGFTSTLLAEDIRFDVQSQREFVGIMDEEADKLTDLIDQLIDVSRLQAGTLRIDAKAQPFLNALNVSRTQLNTLSQDHQLLLDVPASLPLVVIDEQRIAQVLANLVDNARKYSPLHSRITVRALEAGAHIQVEVSDEGEGIPPEERATIFEAFRQVDRRTRQRGAGLGLAICKGLVEAHGGAIWIEDRDTLGTCVVLTLPIQRSETVDS